MNVTFKHKWLLTNIRKGLGIGLDLMVFVKRYFTVYALSSGQGKCGVAVIRISGKQAKESILKMTKPDKLPKPRIATLRYICHPKSGEHLDKGLVIWFPGPNSFTGEDSVEFHTHGGPAIIKAVLSALGQLPNFVPAQPGDFTKRAFFNYKLDLTSVEGLGDLIHAETEAQRKQALRQMEGSLADCYTKWRQQLIKCRANIEAYIDFSEDENIPQGVLLDVESILKSMITEMNNHLHDSRRGERLKSGLNMVILGRPNVGKSTFLNIIVKRPAAIVSPIAGTTRDVVEISLDIGGYPVNVSDTAGLRRTEDVVEKEGVRRALNKVKSADIVLVVVEAAEILEKANSAAKFDFEEFLLNYFFEVGVCEISGSRLNKCQYEWFENSQYVILINKIDLITSELDRKFLQSLVPEELACIASMETNEGIDEVLYKMRDTCSVLCSSGTSAESPYLTSARHRSHIEKCLGHLNAVIQGQSNDEYCEPGLLYREVTLLLAAQQLQLAANQLGQVTGHITTDDILDHIFSSFCIGK